MPRDEHRKGVTESLRTDSMWMGWLDRYVCGARMERRHPNL